MPVIIGALPQAGVTISAFSAPIIEMAGTKFPTQDSDWQIQPDFTLVKCEVTASSIQPGTCEVMRRYGQGNNNVKMPFDAKFVNRNPMSLAGRWLRLKVVVDQSPVVSFVGQIESEPNILTGSAQYPSGTQNFIAFGALKVLQKLSISQSNFLKADNTTTAMVGWIPAMNSRDRRGLLVGNRSDTFKTASDGSKQYFYGGKTLWTHLTYAQYLIDSFIQQPDTGPKWTLAGQTDVLDGMKTTLDFGESATAAEMLKQLINPKYGVDFCVVPNDKGFAITVFALTDQTASVAGVTMPKNPSILNIDRTTQTDLVDCHIVETTERRVDTVKVIGKRIVVCGTLWGAGGSPGDMPPGSPPPSAPIVAHNPATLVKRWSDALETAYINAGGPNTDNDAFRRREQYRDVYQHLGAPSDWDLDKGAWAVATTADGHLTTGVYQVTVRETLGWIPLRQGYDYTQILTSQDIRTRDTLLDSAKDNTDGKLEPEVSAPLAWIYDSLPTKAQAPQYIQCELNGIGCGRPHLDWGVFLHASPNHLLALNSWTDTQIDSTSTPPAYDYNSVVATVAIESDHRIALAYDLPGKLAAGDGSVMTVEDDGAEMWVILPGTIVDTDASGKLVAFGSNKTNDTGSNAPTVPVIIRDDIPRLALTLAGIISRYTNERARAQFTWKGFKPYAGLLGYILNVFQQGDNVQRVGGVVTSIEWTLGKSPQTVLKTGYA